MIGGGIGDLFVPAISVLAVAGWALAWFRRRTLPRLVLLVTAIFSLIASGYYPGWISLDTATLAQTAARVGLAVGALFVLRADE